ncbi:unnamed protein product [Orchesella dallaii]|uniref:Uncharacterized protein n=1 Tax=Orchesella dallaii TaxID=48710 RepID=A0ABP1RMH2_9HEXA
MASVLRGALNAQLLLQKFVELPLILQDSSSDLPHQNIKYPIRVLSNPKFCSGRKFAWTVLKYLMQLLQAIFCYKVIYLCLNRIDGLDWEQVSIYIIMLLINIGSHTCYVTMEEFQDDSLFLIQKSLQMSNVLPGWPSRSRLPTIGELLIYFLFLLPITISPVPFMAPIFRSYDTVELTWNYFFGNIGCGIYVLVFETMLGIVGTLAAKPYEKSKSFKMFWNHLLHDTLSRKKLSSCQVIGFQCGPIRVFKPKTVLRVNDEIVNSTASIILIR